MRHLFPLRQPRNGVAILLDLSSLCLPSRCRVKPSKNLAFANQRLRAIPFPIKLALWPAATPVFRCYRSTTYPCSLTVRTLPAPTQSVAAAVTLIPRKLER
ncbi:hypothetical protein HD554DRAFT_384317 [Boletus coccyginus]|nr:hypothetical protein HD554DRAFT_384317 [Boletus coccyginus]